MDEFGITPEALAESIRHDRNYPPLYRDARGNEWNGLGDMPDWLRAAKNAGVSEDFFRIETKRELIAPFERTDVDRPQTDPRQLDLFASF